LFLMPAMIIDFCQCVVGYFLCYGRCFNLMETGNMVFFV